MVPTHKPPPPNPSPPPPRARSPSPSLSSPSFVRSPLGPVPAPPSPPLCGELPSPSPSPSTSPSLARRGPCPCPRPSGAASPTRRAAQARPWCPGARGAAPSRLPPPVARLPLPGHGVAPAWARPGVARSPPRGPASVRPGLGAPRCGALALACAHLVPAHAVPAPGVACVPALARGLVPTSGAARHACSAWHGAAPAPAPASARGPVPARSPRPVPARPPLLARPRQRGPAARLFRRVPGAARPQLGVVGPRRSLAACAARSALARPHCLLAARSVARAWLGPGVRAARSRRVSVALRARVLAWCARCFGMAHRALGMTHSFLSRVTCSSTPRLARLPLATCLPPMYFMHIDHVVLMKWKLNSKIDYISYFM
jgi:hypothetical protein